MYMRQKHQWDIKERLVEEKYNFKKKDLNMLKSRIPEITHLSPETGRWNAVYAGTKNGWFEVRGVYPDYFLINCWRWSMVEC